MRVFLTQKRSDSGQATAMLADAEHQYRGKIEIMPWRFRNLHYIILETPWLMLIDDPDSVLGGLIADVETITLKEDFPTRKPLLSGIYEEKNMKALVKCRRDNKITIDEDDYYSEIYITGGKKIKETLDFLKAIINGEKSPSTPLGQTKTKKNK